jgi:Na+/H+ antiporter NhaD/arsenite permease-like protein
LVKERQIRLWFAGLIIIAANAGGAFSPIGDVTTTMLWIADKVTTPYLFGYLLLPSLVCMLVPTYLASRLSVFKGDLDVYGSDDSASGRFSSTMLYLGLSAIIFVPFFKNGYSFTSICRYDAFFRNSRYFCRNMQFFKV